jgi:DNA-directed RNA polymerase specialized sigma24 family protein
MPPSESVTEWIAGLKAGDPTAAQPLWERYFRQLVDLARARLRAAPRRVADEEDVALSVFDSLCRGAATGRFPLLADRDDLWRLLVVVTARKAANLVKHERRQKRGGGRVVDEEALAPANAPDASRGLEAIIGREPTPAFAYQVAEECRRLLGALDDAQLRDIAILKLEGYTDAEVAARLGCTDRTVRRRLQLIRKVWQPEMMP